MSNSSRESESGMGDETTCACGCGATFRIFDNKKRERQFLRGHYFRYLHRLYAKAKRKK